jgi:gliding motility-associated-like protein
MRIQLLLLFAFVAINAQSQCINTFPYMEDFESSNNTWTSGGLNNGWQKGLPNKFAIQSAASGVNCWVTGGLVNSFYSFGEKSFVESPCYDFTSLTNPMVRIKIYWESERNFDGTTFQYSLNNGSTWITLGTNNEPTNCYTENWFNTASCNSLNTLASPTHCWTGNSLPNNPPCLGGGGSLGWVTAKHCMSALAGEPNVKFRFAFGVGTNCNDYDGFAFDDFEILEAPSTPPSFTTLCAPNKTYNFTNTSTCYTSYNWNFGDAASGANNLSSINNPTHTFTTGGIYTVTLSATGPCGLNSTTTQTVSVMDVALTAISPLCFNQATGTITSIVQNGTMPFGYSINAAVSGSNGNYVNLNSGTYIITVTDANSCSVKKTVTLNNPPAINFTSVTKTDPLCTNQNNGSISTLASGGTGSLSYVNQNLPSTNANGIFNNLSAAVYTITVLDANLCSITTTVTLQSNNPILITSITTTPESCSPGTDGTIIINATGGNGILTYSIGLNFISTNTITALPANTYTITIKDANGCNATSTAIISNPNTPIFTTITQIPQSCSANIDGVINASCSTPCNYTLLPTSINNNTGVFTNLKAGVYTVTAINAQGCLVTTKTILDILPAMQFSTVNVTAVSCEANNGILQTNVLNGIGNITYSLNNEPPVFSNTFQNLSIGSYTVVATDEKSCSISTLVSLKNIVTCCDNIFVANAFTPNGDFNNEFFTIAHLKDIRLVSFEIFNRFGNKVFETKDTNQPWNGAYKGIACETGSYFYLLTYNCGTTNDVKKVKGSIELIR